MRFTVLAVFLLLSLGGNLWLWLGAAREQPAAPRPVLVAPAVPGAAERRQAWAKLYSSDPAEFAKRLRAGGFPESIVRCLVRAELDRIFAERRKQLWSPPENLPWWKEEPEPSFETRIALRDLNRERRRLERTMLGEDLSLYRGSRSVECLPAEKKKAADDILNDYEDLLASVRPRYLSEDLMPESLSTRRRLLLEERDKDLALVCEPHEVALVNILADQQGYGFLRDLDSITLSNEELVQLGAAFRKDVAIMTGPSMFTDDAILEQKLRSIVGPERCATVMMESSPDYQSAASICKERGLPEANAKEAFRLTRELAQRAKEIVLRSDLEVADMQREIASSAQNTELRLFQLLGNDGGKKFWDSVRYLEMSKTGNYIFLTRRGGSYCGVYKGMEP